MCQFVLLILIDEQSWNSNNVALKFFSQYYNIIMNIV